MGQIPLFWHATVAGGGRRAQSGEVSVGKVLGQLCPSLYTRTVLTTQYKTQFFKHPFSIVLLVHPKAMVLVPRPVSRDDPGHAPMRRYEYSTCTAWIAAHVTTLVTLLHIWIRSCPIHGPIFPVKPRDSRSSGIKPERLWGCTPPPHHWPPPPPCTAAPWGRPEDIYLSALKPYWGVGARGGRVCVSVKTVNREGVKKY